MLQLSNQQLSRLSKDAAAAFRRRLRAWLEAEGVDAPLRPPQEEEAFFDALLSECAAAGVGRDDDRAMIAFSALAAGDWRAFFAHERVRLLLEDDLTAPGGKARACHFLSEEFRTRRIRSLAAQGDGMDGMFGAMEGPA